MRLTNLLCALLLMLAAGCAHVPAPTASLEPGLGASRKPLTITASRSTITKPGRGRPSSCCTASGPAPIPGGSWCPALAKNHRVFTLDLKGYGLSDKPEDGHYAVSDQAEMVAAFIRSQDLHDLVMMGHSMGGAVTLMTYLKLREDRPRPHQELVLIDSAGYPQKMPWFIWLAKVPGLGSVGGQVVPPRFATALVLKKCYYDKDKITEEQIDTYAYYGSLPGAREAVVARPPSNSCRQTSTPSSPNITDHQRAGPDYLGRGGRSGAAVGRPEFQAGYPELANWSSCPNAAICPPEEEPQETTRIVEAFLKK